MVLDEELRTSFDMEDKLRKSNLDEDVIKEAKKIGFSDKQIGRCLGS